MHVNNLPNELLLEIFALSTDLNAEPPSTTKFTLEPSQNLTQAEEHPIKDLSRVCKRWRPLVLPDLVSYAQVSLYSYWVPAEWDEVQRFVEFLVTNDLLKFVKNLLVYARKGVEKIRTSSMETLIIQETKNLWRKIFSTINPRQLIIVAPPSTMAILAGSDDGEWDSWLFDMRCHYLKLSTPLGSSHEASGEAYSSTPTTPTGRSCQRFVYNIRPWTHVCYNEGTAIKGYGHYEYQWKKMPAILPNLMEWIAKGQDPQVQSLNYTSLFPYRSHLKDILHPLERLPHFREFRTKLADPDLLDDKERLGKAQPSDLYREWENCHSAVGEWLASMRGGTVYSTADTDNPNLEALVVKNVGETSHRVPRPLLEKKEDPLRWTSVRKQVKSQSIS